MSYNNQNQVGGNSCKHCGGPMAWSTRKSKWYCANKCWLQNQPNQPNQYAPQPTPGFDIAEFEENVRNGFLKRDTRIAHLEDVIGDLMTKITHLEEEVFKDRPEFLRPEPATMTLKETPKDLTTHPGYKDIPVVDDVEEVNRELSMREF